METDNNPFFKYYKHDGLEYWIDSNGFRYGRGFMKEYDKSMKEQVKKLSEYYNNSTIKEREDLEGLSFEEVIKKLKQESEEHMISGIDQNPDYERFDIRFTQSDNTNILNDTIYESYKENSGFNKHINKE